MERRDRKGKREEGKTIGYYTETILSLGTHTGETY